MHIGDFDLPVEKNAENVNCYKEMSLERYFNGYP